jgi:diadenosine tetraphosphate (Ap4A) HIT family hydrolase
MAFTLHPQLENDTTTIGEFPLCTVLLAKDDSVPWLILVPKADGIRELHHLSMEKQQQFLVESQVVCQALETLFKPDKINIGALGNMVPQLHIHHVARFISDIAWPGPIWGNHAGKFRSEDAQQALIQQLCDTLKKERTFIPA